MSRARKASRNSKHSAIKRGRWASHTHGWIRAASTRIPPRNLGRPCDPMYRWYAEAKTCIAYLEDVDGGPGGRSLEESVWFTRGWTLQELIAPSTMLFYDGNWNLIGLKADLVESLSSITGIPVRVLTHEADLSTCSVAQRMSWAAGRSTERVEDTAYSLLGLFDVSLDMAYGERERAFIRLQEEIVKHSADQSIFAWSLDLNNHPKRYSGLFAPSPASFAECRGVVATGESEPFAISNVGLSISLPTLPYCMLAYYAYLDCADQGQEELRRYMYAILVAGLPESKQWVRIMDHENASVFLRERADIDIHGVERDIRVRQHPRESPLCFGRREGFWLRTLEPPHHRNCDVQLLSNGPTPDKDRALLGKPRGGRTAGVISLEFDDNSSITWSQLRWIKLGFDDAFNPTILLANSSGGTAHGLMARDFREAARSTRFSHEARRMVFRDGWLYSSRSEAGHSFPSRDGWITGIHRVDWTGEPIEGLQYIYNLKGLGLQIRLSLLPDPDPSPGPLGPPEKPQHIWTIDMVEVPRSSSKSRVHGAQWTAMCV